MSAPIVLTINQINKEPYEKIAGFVLSVAALAMATPASAQFRKPEDAVKYRQSAMSIMGNYMGRIGAMTSGRAPFDAKVMQENTRVLVVLSSLPIQGFVANTESLKTRAKPEIWKEQDKFKGAFDKMVADVNKLDATAKTGNLDAIKTAFGDVNTSCNACHDNYQAKQ